MKQSLNLIASLSRIVALVTLCGACLLLVAGEVAPTVPLEGAMCIKLAGFGFGWIAYRLYKTWKTSDKLIARYNDWCMRQNEEFNEINTNA